MNSELKNFLRDLIYLVQEEYNEGLEKSKKAEAEVDRAYNQGATVAYWSVLSTIKAQLTAFGYDTEEFGEIVSRPFESIPFLDNQKSK